MNTDQKNAVVLKHLGILVTSFCNLNCRRCADLIPQRENAHYKIEDIQSDLSRISQAVDSIEEVPLIGGEVLLYPDLAALIKICRVNPKIGRIYITTNGTMLPAPALIETLKEADVLVRVSGYSGAVAPNRNEILRALRAENVQTEDLDGMVWFDMGSFEPRKRNLPELKKIFETCSMKNCVTINRRGKIYFCSRQMAANETELYPDAPQNEYVDVRSGEIGRLRDAIEHFLSLKYLSTCDYCDGISCATRKKVPTAVQILKKSEYLKFLEGYITLENIGTPEDMKNACVRIAGTLCDNFERLEGVSGAAELFGLLQNILDGGTAALSDENLKMLSRYFYSMFTELTQDYIFSVTGSGDLVKRYFGAGGREGFSNVVTVGLSESSDAQSLSDIDVSVQELENVLRMYAPIDGYDYNRMFIESKFDVLKNEAVDCVVSGLSYTAFGIFEGNRNAKTVNLSVTGQDLPYSMLMARKALELNPGVRVVVLPLSYYHVMYDMSADSAQLHKDVVAKIDYPLLREAYHYAGALPSARPTLPVNPIFTRAFDLDALRGQRDRKFREQLGTLDFFNAFNPPSPTGALKFKFTNLDVSERYRGAGITAVNNERVCTEEGAAHVSRCLYPFLSDMEKQGVKVLFFNPPMTGYLDAAYDPQLKERYYALVSEITAHKNCSFLEFTKSGEFSDEDFCDYEHLNRESGGKKLTAILSDFVDGLLGLAR